MTVIAELRAKFTARQTGTVVGGGLTFDVSLDKVLALADGGGASQANLLWTDQRSLPAGAPETVDLSGVLADAMGDVVAAAEVVGLLVIADEANDNDVIIAGDALGAAPSTVIVKPGGFAFLGAAGAGGMATIEAGVSDELTVTNGGPTTAVVYTIAVLGRTPAA